jgi:hypothetical protein
VLNYYQKHYNNLMNSKQPNPAFNQTEVTLRFLANSVYQGVMEKKNNVREPTKDDYKFYRKRAFAMVKDMMRGKYPSDHLKDIHMKYVNELINHMKVQDTTDILQKDYPPKLEHEVKELADSELSDDLIEEANKIIMKELDADGSTMDDFVTKKIIKMKAPTPPPIRREANISTEEHKTKGLKKKKSKKPKDSKSSC